MSNCKKDIINIKTLLNTFINTTNEHNYINLQNAINNSSLKVIPNINNIKSQNFTEFKKEIGDNPRMIHIYFSNLLDDLNVKINSYLKLKSHNDFLKVTDNSILLDELKKENQENKRQTDINTRMSKYFEEDIEYNSWKTNVCKYIFFFFLLVIICIVVVNKQYENKKILFYVLLLFFITYSFEPLYFYIKLNTDTYGELFTNYILWYFLFLIFGLFIALKNYVFFPEKNSKIYMGALSIIVASSFMLIIYRYFSYIKNIKTYL